MTLTREGQSITFPSAPGRYVVGPERVCNHMRCMDAGWQPIPPTLYDVLTSLKADSTNGQTFADWCGDYGMDTDSIKARELYFACQESEDRSRKFFGADWSRLVDDEDYQ